MLTIFSVEHLNILGFIILFQTPTISKLFTHLICNDIIISV